MGGSDLVSNRKIEGSPPREPLNVFNDAQFLPAPRESGEAEIISRPALTYWRDAMMRLRRDKLAMTCLALIIVVSIIGIVGPWFYPVKMNGVPFENQQNPNEIDQEPTMGDQILVTDDNTGFAEEKVLETYDAAAPLAAPDSLAAPEDFKLGLGASVSGVPFTWKTIPGVSGYQLYRILVDRTGTIDTQKYADGATERGIAIGDISNPAQMSYTDSVGLDSSERYVYTIVPYVTDPNTFQRVEGAKGAALAVELKQTMKLTDALAIKPDVQVGQVIAGRSHIFGTDDLGRDVLARMVSGTRIDMMLALLVPALSIFLGMIYGAISGLIGKTTDTIMMRIVEIVDNFPDILVFILMQVAFGKGVLTLVIALSMFSWAGFARIVRGEVLRLREIEFVQASRLLGAPTMRLVMRHIGPNLLGLIIIAWSSRIPGVIASETFLSMLGLGLEQPTPSWGNVVNDAAHRLQVSPIEFFLPASVLGVTLLAFYLLGNSLRDAFDPKLRGRG